jgi:hypothetical protein
MTFDDRRALRIRYVDPMETVESEKVASLTDYRAVAARRHAEIEE